MDHVRVISAHDLEAFANKNASRGALPEVLNLLIEASCPDRMRCAIQDADHIDEPGVDGIVETPLGYSPFLPAGKCYLEASNERDPRRKATADLDKRTEQLPDDARAATTFVFATFRSWRDPEPESWQRAHATKGWKDLRVLDSQQLANWLHHFPAIARWLLAKIDPGKNTTDWRTVAEHWANLRKAHRAGDPDLGPALFLSRRDRATAKLRDVFEGRDSLLSVNVENSRDLEDCVAAFVANQDEPTRSTWSHRCLFVSGRDAWSAMASRRSRHVLVAAERLELEGAGEALLREATASGHAVILPISGFAPNDADLVDLPNPTKFQVEEQLRKDGYSTLRVREVVRDGFTSLSILKNRLCDKPDLPPYAGSPVARDLALACLVGSFDEGHEQDLTVVTGVFETPFADWHQAVLPILHNPGIPLSQRDGRWRVLARGESWRALSHRLVDADLRRFEEAALRVLGEIDPAIQVPKAERIFAATIHKKGRQFSEPLRKGIAETLALLGSRAENLLSCKSGMPAAMAASVVNKLLAGADWTRWMSLHNLLPILAEAAPEAFLAAVEAALADHASSPFPKLFAEESTGFGGRNYITGLLWALETLAWHPTHLVWAARLLGMLASIDPGGNWANRPANSLRAILLPWHPQTGARIDRRVAAVQSLVKTHPEVAWKLVLSLLPDTMDSTSGTHKPTWRTELMDAWEEGVSQAEYYEQVESYAALALKLASTDGARLGALIDDIPNLPSASSKVILEQLVPVGLSGKTAEETLPVWEALASLASRHRAHPDAKWVMPEDEIAAVERAAAAIEPRDPALRHRRTFGPPNHDMLVFGKGATWEDHIRIVSERRRVALAEIVDGPSIDPVVAFAMKVEAPGQVGEALATLERRGDDTQILPRLFDAEDRHTRMLAEGYALARWRRGSWAWVGTLDLTAWTVAQKVAFFLCLPFHREVWRRAEEVLGAEAREFWKVVPPIPWGRDDLEEAAERLIHHGRSRFAVGCCAVARVAQQQLAPAVAIRALLGCRSDETKDPLDNYLVEQLITWVQEQPDVEEEDLFAIEWYFLPLLEHRGDARPRALEGKLARDPAWFCEAVRVVFRADQEDESRSADGTADVVALRNAVGRLLHGMRTIPGMRPDGTIDEPAFKQWYAEVMRIAGETGYRGGIMSQLGQTFGRAAMADDWYVNLSPIAAALDAVGADAMRRAFWFQVRNNRGVHWVTGGREERKIAERYLGQASAIEELGWSRLANTIRDIAAAYQQDAERAEKEEEDDA